MPILTLLLLGILEGFTEFLPVSSTGHLILASALIGFEGEAAKSFKIAIQLGAILAVLMVYHRRFADVIVGMFGADANAWKFARNISIAVLPALVIGAAAYPIIRALLESPVVVCVALIVGGFAILFLEKRVKTVRFGSVEAIGARTALLIGAFQCLAMIPGVSRSGASILGALSVGVERKTAAEFSFFLAVPTMIAATGYDLFQNRAALGMDALASISIGFGAAFITALIVIKAFVAIVSRFGFTPFAWYRIGVGTAGLIWLLS